jgi:hypothetical protein
MCVSNIGFFSLKKLILDLWISHTEYFTLTSFLTCVFCITASSFYESIPLLTCSHRHNCLISRRLWQQHTHNCAGVYEGTPVKFSIYDAPQAEE